MLLAVGVCGCLKRTAALHYFENSPSAGTGEVQFYKDYATRIAEPCPDPGPLSETAIFTDPPRRLRHPRKDDLLDLTLPDAIHLALQNSDIIRTNGEFLSPGNALMRNPEAVPSVFDVAIQESGVLFGRRGVEAALSDFDAQFTTTMTWNRNEQVQNNLFESGGLLPGDTLTSDNAQFSSQVAKTMADGSQFAVSHNWDYTYNNAAGRLFPSVYTGFLRAEYRRPLLAGSGEEFTRINGPIGQSLTGVTGVSQGVVIARINADISIADFELAVTALVKETEDAYWDLALAYRTYDAEKVAQSSALRTWQETEAKAPQLAPAAEVAQALDNYYDTRFRAENALADIYALESRLRRLVGLPVNDGRIIRPVTEPAIAEFLPDWRISLAQALTNRAELRRQKWAIKSFELQLQAARSLAQPRFDFVSGYQINAFGDHLLSYDDDDEAGTQQGLDSAYETLTQGDQTSWDLGVQFSMPIGFRLALTQVQNLELRLAKARAALFNQELEVSHELAAAFQQLDRFYQTAQTNFNRRNAAKHRVEATQAEFGTGRVSLDLVLRAQISLAQAEVAYYRSLVEYNKSVAELYYRMGTLLDLNNVELAENLWTPEAYIDALRRAWERTNAIPAPHLKTEPLEFVADPYAPPAEVLLPDVPLMLDPSDPLPLEGPEFVPPELPPPAPPVEGEPDLVIR